MGRRRPDATDGAARVLCAGGGAGLRHRRGQEGAEATGGEVMAHGSWFRARRGMLWHGLPTVPHRSTAGLPVPQGRGDLRSNAVARSGDRATTRGVVALVVGLLLTAPLRAQAPDFETQVLPVLTRAGCNSGACHGAA